MTDPLSVLSSRSSGLKKVPTEQELILWAGLAYQSSALAQVSIKIVDEQESQALNFQYRNKNQSTNVLSFPLHAPIDDKTELLGDLAICAPVVNREAEEQGKSSKAHWAHMVIHGLLHLQGYDHEKPKDAEAMEQLEIELLKRLGFADPY